MTPAIETPASSLAEPALGRPMPRRASEGDNGDALGIGWLHGSLHLAVFRRQKLAGNWSASAPVNTMVELANALDEALRELKFGGTETFLLLENDQFVHQIETMPQISDAAAQSYLHGRVQRYEKEHAPTLWVGQPAAGLRKERSFILHMLPKAFYDGLCRLLIERRLDLTRILPLVVPIQRELDRFPISKGRPVLVAVEAGGATAVMVAKVGGELLFARTLLASWGADPARIGLEINRSLLYANQQFGCSVERVWLLGQDNQATTQVNAKCGAGRQITVLPTTPVEWLQTVAKLPPRHPVNLVAGSLKRKRLHRSIRRVLLVACWSALVLLGVDAWTTAQAWSGEQDRYARLQADEPRLSAEREKLVERNRIAERDRTFIREVEEDRLPPVPGKFAGYIASILPHEMRLTDLAVKWEESTAAGWSFRIDGTVEADDETARELVAALQRQLIKSPWRVRSNDTARAVVAMPRSGDTAAADVQRFRLEGVMLEN